jgi:hypothetical protein
VRSFAAEVRFPLAAPDVVLMRIEGEDFWLGVPSALELLDIAANYAWQRLVPDAVAEPGRQRLLDWLDDPDHPASWKRLHVAVQPLGLYLYGVPFFVAARIASNLLHHYSLFRVWALLNLNFDAERAEAADWIAAAMAWLLSSKPDAKERNALWAELTTPGRLPVEAPGVLPEWMG